MTICLLPFDNSNSRIGVTVLFPVPTSPMITKCSEKSIESRIEKIGSFGPGGLSVVFFCWPSSLSSWTAGKRSPKSTIGSLPAKGASSPPEYHSRRGRNKPAPISALRIVVGVDCVSKMGYPRIRATSGIVARLISMSRNELHGEAEDRRLRTRPLRLTVLSYLTIVLFLWMARILAVSGIISLPLGFGAVGVQANLVTGVLFLALGPGILGMRVLNRRQRLESIKTRSDTNRAK